MLGWTVEGGRRMEGRKVDCDTADPETGEGGCSMIHRTCSIPSRLRG